MAANYFTELSNRLSEVQASYQRRWRFRLYSIGGLALICLAVIVLALTVGSVRIPVTTVWNILVSNLGILISNLILNIPVDWSSTTDMIVMGIRLPRIMMAGIAGAALGVAGATYQGLFRNPLADPYLIGVAQGAALGAAVGFLLPWVFLGHYFIPLLAFLGALAAVAVVYAIARVGKTLPVTTLILAGVAIGSLFISITSYLTLISHDKMPGILSWLMGRFSLSNWDQVKLIAPYVIVGLAAIFIYSRHLNVMQLDEEQAQQLGINVEHTKLILLAASTLITAAAVCFVGTIGFVGIIVPHAVRLIWGPDHRSLLPLSAFAGAILLILADTASRTLMPPAEIPVGVITAFLGAPFFLFLLRRKKKAVF
ncbi:MAG: iron chelate uptake ABC transporter family permease subunit [Dehalococcoidales bacterium]|nr:iron chelate uptake ABC transporter family permease subunit [Dehalococcoidales bacterium]